MGGNYEKSLFNQLQETILLVEKLSKDLSDIKASHAKEIGLLKEENALLKKQNEQLKAENQMLKEIMNKNSGNSSKPPSSDGFKKIHNSREKSNKKPGGQPGHKGHVPKYFDNPTEIHEMKSVKCKCGGNVRYSGEFSKKQFVDIEIKTNIVEFHEYHGVCECCGNKVENSAPITNSITYGENLKALSNMLSVEGNVSINRIQQMLLEISGGLLNLSEGTICKWNKDLAKLLTPVVEKIKGKLLASSVIHKDETSIRVDKTINWFHVLSNAKYSLFYAHKKRGREADEEAAVLPAYSGVLVHDHLKGLYHFTCDHAECNAHILRYLKAATENHKRGWAQDMITLLLKAKELSGRKLPDAYEIQAFNEHYDNILEQGQQEFLRDEKPDYNGEDMKLLRRMKKYRTEHLRFLSGKNVPFDNNQAERDLRMIKAKTKISGCFRSENGGSVFANIKSYTATLRKNGQNVFAGIISAWAGSPFFC